MERVLSAFAVAGVFAVASPAFALGDCNGNGACSSDDHSITTQGGTGYGGTGYGGNAYGGKAENNVGNGFGNFSPSSSARSEAEAAAFAGAKAGAVGVGAQGQGQSLKFEQTFEAAPIPDKYTVRNTPGVGLGGLYPSSPCMGTTNIGGSGPGIGLAFGTSWIDTNCQLMETARFAPTEADKKFVWCKSDYAKGSPSCAAAEKKAEAAPVKQAEVAPAVERPTKRKTSGEQTRAWYQANPEILN